MKTYLKFLLVLSFILCGCSVRHIPEPFIRTTNIPAAKPYVKHEVPGIYHTVRKKETLWRISRIYNVDLESLLDYNKIEDHIQIEIGEKIFIPDHLRREPAKDKLGNIKTTFIWPGKGKIVSSFKQLKFNTKNRGIDISMKKGSSVVASAAGKVVFVSENMRGYGRTIIIKHNNIFSTVYSNNKSNLVKIGEFVRQGQTIAYAGSTGRATYCMIHFELRKNNKPENPLYYLPR